MDARYNLKEDVSEEAKDLIRSLLNTNPKERLTVGQTLRHPWMLGADINKLPGGEIFNEEEKEVIRT